MSESKKIKKLKKRIAALEARFEALESTYWVSSTQPAPSLPTFDPHEAWKDVVADYEKAHWWGDDYATSHNNGINRYL
jgi:hypothetical protein